MNSSKNNQRKLRRKRRVRSSVVGTKKRPRLSVFRTKNHISVQIIDDQERSTLVSANDKEVVVKGKDGKNSKSETQESKKKDVAFKVGNLLASKARKKKIKKVSFDRGEYKYHGRVASLAEGARKGGLEF